MTIDASELSRLLVYRELLKDDLIRELHLLLSDKGAARHEQHVCGLAARLIAWAEEIGMSGNLAQNYFIYQIARRETLFSLSSEKYQGKIGEGLWRAAVHDIAVLQKVLKKGWKGYLPDLVTSDYKSCRTTDDSSFIAFKELFSGDYDTREIVQNLVDYYKKYGSGDMAACRAFRWERERGMVKTPYVDPIKLDDIVGYERQKKELLANTEAFLSGRMANNVLLSGARGTGKSSSVKALVNKFFNDGLRLVEVKKEDFKELPQIMRLLRPLNKKFILFLDDLSFEESEVEYKSLKSFIDGGMEIMPDNVLLYATSNRRHLIRETWDDRSGGEVHSQDTVNEKLSLSDRFGINIYYPSPNQEEYFEIVEKLAKKSKINMAEEKLREEALKWEMRHSGRSGRVAKQFIAYLSGLSGRKNI